MSNIFFKCPMPPKKTETKKDIILYVGVMYSHIYESLLEYRKKNNSSFRIGILYDSKQKLSPSAKKLYKKLDLVLSCNTKSELQIQKTLAPYIDQLQAVTCRFEGAIPMLARIAPHVPYMKLPTSESLLWATNKLDMRRRLRTYNPKISPAYTVVTDISKESLDKINKKVGFPLIVKPASLAASRLVSICYHRDELEKVLRHAFKTIKSIYKAHNYTREPQMLVEELLEGSMYSIDGYVNSRGKLYFCPPVYVKTGKSIGFDDFFGYMQMTPTRLKKDSIAELEDVAEQAVHALCLKSTTVHVELFRTESGWKIIELAARVGGFRPQLYELAYGINHTANDVKIHIPKKPSIPKKVKGYSVAMKFFAKKEGILEKLTGINKAKKLDSFVEMTVNKKLGDKCTYAKNGGSSVFNIILFNKNRSDLLADIRRLEQMIKIKVKKKGKKQIILP